MFLIDQNISISQTWSSRTLVIGELSNAGRLIFRVIGFLSLMVMVLRVPLDVLITRKKMWEKSSAKNQ